MPFDSDRIGIRPESLRRLNTLDQTDSFQPAQVPDGRASIRSDHANRTRTAARDQKRQNLFFGRRNLWFQNFERFHDFAVFVISERRLTGFPSFLTFAAFS
jgi:hypothetical protein